MENAEKTPSNTLARKESNVLYRAAWRWHFYAGLYVVPFLVMLAITGLSMMWIAYFDGRDGEKIRIDPQGLTQSMPVSQLAKAVQNAYGDGTLVEYIAPKVDNGASVFRLADGDTQRLVAINPYNAEIVTDWVRRDGWYDFLSDIHGTLLLGDTGDRLIEIAAGFAFVLIATGLYLWWPRDAGGVRKMLVPSLSARGRMAWRSWHAVIGSYISILLMVFLLTGLSWAGIWGEKFVQAWSTFPAEKWDNVPLSDDIHASMNHGAMKDVPWGLEQTPLPASTLSDAPSTSAPSIDSIVATAAALGFQGRHRVNFPSGDTGVWTISQDAMSNDNSNPFEDRFVHIDQYSGKQLVDIGYRDYSVGAKAMAAGIALHEGDMGIWNLVLNTVFCLAVVFVSISGVVMWFKRRPAKAGLLAAPPAPANMPHWRGATVIGLFLCIAFPLVGLTLLVVLAADYLLISRLPQLRSALS